MEALMTRYGNDLGFSYMKFLKDIAEVLFCDSMHERILRIMKLVNVEQPPPCKNPELTIVEVLAKVKGEIVRRRINFESFIRNTELLSQPLKAIEFRRSFSAAGIHLEDCELDILCDS